MASVTLPTEDVKGEVRRILHNNTIDQCMQYNQAMKRDIAAAEEELRDVIGQRYRELIHACDRVVGMDDVCQGIDRAFRKSEETLQSHRRASQSPATQAPTAPDPLSSVPVRHEASESVRLVMRISEAEEALCRTRTLLKQGLFVDAAQSFLDLVAVARKVDTLRDTAAGIGSLHRPVTSDVSMSVVKNFIGQFRRLLKDQMVHTLLTEAASARSTRSATLQKTLLDKLCSTLLSIQRAFECVDGSHASQAMETIVNDVLWKCTETLGGTDAEIRDDELITKAHQLRNLVVLATVYFCRGDSSDEAPLAALAGSSQLRSIEELSRVPVPSADDATAMSDYLSLLKMQLCAASGLSASVFDRRGNAAPTVSSSAGVATPSRFGSVDGWAISPAAPHAGATPQVTSLPLSALSGWITSVLENVQSLLARANVSAKTVAHVERILLFQSVQPADVSAHVIALDIPSSLTGVNDWLNMEAVWTPSVQDAVSSALRRAIAHSLSRVAEVLEAKLATTQTARVASLGRLKPTRYSDHDMVNLVVECCNGIANTNGRGSNETSDCTSFEGVLLQDVAHVVCSALARTPTDATSASDDSVVSLVHRALRQHYGSLRKAVDTIVSDPSKEATGSSADIASMCEAILVLLDQVRDMLGKSDSASATVSPAQTELAALQIDVEALYVACHAPWLKRTISAARQRLSSTYQSIFLAGAGDGESPMHFRQSDEVAALLANVRRWHELEGDTKVHFPCAFTPGVASLVFDLFQEIRRHELEAGSSPCHPLQCGSTPRSFRPSLVAVVEAEMTSMFHSVVEALLSNESVVPPEDMSFQLLFDITCLQRFISTNVRSHPPAMGAITKQIEEHIDVVNLSITRPLLMQAVEAAWRRSRWGSSPPWCAAAPALDTSSAVGVPPASSPSFLSSTSGGTCIALEPEADRLPLLPIATPSQSRAVVSSLQTALGNEATRVGTRNASSAQGAPSAGATDASSAAATLWSATSKLRSVAALWTSSQ